MKKIFFCGIFWLSVNAVDAMKSDPYAVSCPITVRLQVPVPIDRTTEPGPNDINSLIAYLKTLPLNMNNIPLRLYESIIDIAARVPIDSELTNMLLSFWGIEDSSVFEEKEKIIPELIRNICEILAEVKTEITNDGSQK
ncbi:MAG: hypothetical protein LBO73_04475 [Holosporaceae bacterium]|nr:hypothetical protein [Holosporaceae bacterium]